MGSICSSHDVTSGHSFLFFFKQKTAYEMRISDWSSDVCSSDLSDRRAEDCEPEQGEACEHQGHSLLDHHLLVAECGRKLGEIVGSDADDDGEHHDLDARAYDVAEHALCEEGRAVPKCKGYENETRARCQFELQYGDKQLHQNGRAP